MRLLALGNAEAYVGWQEAVGTGGILLTSDPSRRNWGYRIKPNIPPHKYWGAGAENPCVSRLEAGRKGGE